MTYKHCNDDDSRELYIYANNTQSVMRHSFEPVARNLERKRNAGKFDPSKAIKAFRAVADQAAKAYYVEYCLPKSPPAWHEIFNVPCRDKVAAELLDTFLAELECGNGWLAR